MSGTEPTRIIVRPTGIGTLDEWLALRTALWPDGAEEHLDDMRGMLARDEQLALLASDEVGRTVGLAEAAIRYDYVNGCDTSPVGFLEGIYVLPEARRQGVAQALFDVVVDWVRDRGCTELASDAALDNVASHAMHAALGFAETQRVVYFKRLV